MSERVSGITTPEGVSIPKRVIESALRTIQHQYRVDVMATGKFSYHVADNGRLVITLDRGRGRTPVPYVFEIVKTPMETRGGLQYERTGLRLVRDAESAAVEPGLDGTVAGDVASGVRGELGETLEGV